MQRTRDVHRRWQRLCSQPGKQYAELWPALPLPESGSNTIWVESWQVTTLATDTNGPASAMAYAAHPHPLHRCMSRSSIPMWHGKERERTYRPRVQIIMEEDWRHSNPTTRIHSQQVLKKKRKKSCFPTRNFYS